MFCSWIFWTKYVKAIVRTPSCFFFCLLASNKHASFFYPQTSTSNFGVRWRQITWRVNWWLNNSNMLCISIDAPWPAEDIETIHALLYLNFVSYKKINECGFMYMAWNALSEGRWSELRLEEDHHGVLGWWITKLVPCRYKTVGFVWLFVLFVLYGFKKEVTVHWSLGSVSRNFQKRRKKCLKLNIRRLG